MTMTNAQKELLIGAVYGQAENAQESLKMGADPADYSVEHKDDFTWEMAVEHGKGTVTFILEDSGFKGAVEDSYIYDEDETGNPEGLADVKVEDLMAYIKTLKGIWVDNDVKIVEKA